MFAYMFIHFLIFPWTSPGPLAPPWDAADWHVSFIIMFPEYRVLIQVLCGDNWDRCLCFHGHGTGMAVSWHSQAQ